MKEIISIVSLVFLLSGCGGDPMNKKIDGSSEKAFQTSLESLKNNISEEDLKEFTNAMTSSYMSEAMSEVFSGAFSAEKKGSIEIWKFMDGKTPNQIISTSKEKTKKKKEIKVAPIQIKLNEAFTDSEIEFLPLSIKIGKLINQNDSLTRSDEEYLLIRIQLKNKSEGKIFTLMGTWGDSILKDNYENSYNTKSDSYLSRMKNVTTFDDDFRPNKIIQDTLIFPVPLDNAKQFKLVLAPTIYRKSESLTKLSLKKYELSFSKSNIGK